MTYKTILVNLNDLERNAALVASAAELARDFDAHLQGVYIIPAIEIYGGIGFTDAPLIFEGNRELFREAEKSVRELFHTAANKAGIRFSIEVIDSASPDITGHVIDRARRSDIVIVNQPPAKSGDVVAGREFIERILLSTGRPTLLLPRDGRTTLAADLVIVGWNGRREAARAAFDAIPLLKRAKKVEIVWVDPEMEYPHPGSGPGAELAASLERHGINAAIKALSTGGREVGEALMTRVADSGAELLVMGAYGHSRLSELILGGATRSVLSEMKCPVLFSH